MRHVCILLVIAMTCAACGSGSSTRKTEPKPSKPSASKPAKSSAPRELSIHGKEIEWKAKLPSGWIGGTSGDIKRVLAGTSDKTLRGLLEMILPSAQRSETYWIHLDIEDVQTDTLSAIRTRVADMPDLDIENEDAMVFIWAAMAQNVESETEGASTQVVESRTLKTGGRPAAEALFRTKHKNGGSSMDLMHIVRYDETRRHLFRLSADRSKWDARVAELRRVLSTLSYP
jgi:hypothetical protein